MQGIVPRSPCPAGLQRLSDRPHTPEPSPQEQLLLCARPKKPRPRPPARHGTIDLFISISYSSSTFPNAPSFLHYHRQRGSRGHCGGSKSL